MARAKQKTGARKGRDKGGGVASWDWGLVFVLANVKTWTGGCILTSSLNEEKI